MTQQQIVKLLDLPERTLRDWKKSRNRLYTLLENIEYEEAKSKIDVVDLDDTIEFNPKEFSQNLFWQTNQKSHCSSRFIRTVCRSDSDSFKVEIF